MDSVSNRLIFRPKCKTSGGGKQLMKVYRSLQKKKSSGAWYPLCWRYEFCIGGEEQSSSTRMELKRSGAREGNLLKSPPTILTAFYDYQRI